jgi:hypothetical protein
LSAATPGDVCDDGTWRVTDAPLTDDPAVRLAVLERGVPFAHCERCEEVSSLSKCRSAEARSGRLTPRS